MLIEGWRCVDLIFICNFEGYVWWFDCVKLILRVKKNYNNNNNILGWRMSGIVDKR